MVEATPKVDIVVATRNRPEDLAKFLPTVVAQTERRFRLLVVDQSDDPSANRRAVEACADARLVHLPQAERGKSKALNFALRRASADVLAFTDDDCTLPVDWLELALRSVETRPKAGVIYGNVLPAPHDPREWFVPSIEFEREKVLRGPLRSRGLLGLGANMVVPRRVLDEIGWFDEDLGPGGLLVTGEECELTYRALCAGYEVVQDPTLAVLHWGARPLAGGVARQYDLSGVYALGAGYGKHLRTLDWRAFAVTAYDTGWLMALFGRAVLKRSPPYHLKRIALFWQGIVKGAALGLRIPASSKE